MKKIVLRQGLYGIIVMTVVSATTYLIFHHRENWDLQEILGYITIVLSLSFVYFGIRQWRDQYNGGQLSFGRGLAIGTLITLLPSVAFGFLSWLEVSVIDPGFNDRYYANYVAQVKKATPPDKLAAALEKLAAEKEMFNSPFMQFFVMFLTVFIIGVIITVVSSLILRRNKPVITKTSV